jgi:hypothetical protein
MPRCLDPGPRVDRPRFGLDFVLFLREAKHPTTTAAEAEREQQPSQRIKTVITERSC